MSKAENRVMWLKYVGHWLSLHCSQGCCRKAFPGCSTASIESVDVSAVIGHTSIYNAQGGQRFFFNLATYRQLRLQVALLGHQFVLLVVQVSDDVGFACQARHKVGLLLVGFGQADFQFLAVFRLLLEGFLSLGGFAFQILKNRAISWHVSDVIIPSRSLSTMLLTAMTSSTRTTLSRGLTFCHKRNQAQLRFLTYLRKLRWTTCRATLSTSCINQLVPFGNQVTWQTYRWSCNFLYSLRVA